MTTQADETPRAVRYVLVLSLVAVTLHWQSRVHDTASARHRLLRGLPYSLFNAVFGWWGVPWGPVRTAQAIAVNLTGVPVEVADSEGMR